MTGEPVAGPPTLPEEELRNNRADCDGNALHHRLIDDYYRARLPKFEDIDTPLFSAANWGGMGLHPRGNFEGYLRAGTEQKWLEVHGDTHFTLFYANYGQALQKRFFDHFLKGEDNGWEQRPKVLLNIRHPGETFVPRAENEWPLARTQWTKFYLHPDREPARRARQPTTATLPYATTGDGLTFSTPPLDRATWRSPGRWPQSCSSPRTPPMPTCSWCCACSIRRARRWCSSARTIRASRSGWAGCAPRTASSIRTRRCPTGPTTRHDEEWPLTPGKPVELDIEIWPTSIVVPPGYRLALSVRGKDYEYDGTDMALPHAPYPMKGVGPFTHTHPQDRPPAIFGGTNTLHFGADMAPYVLLPVIP